MNATPSSTPPFTSTTAPDRPRSDQDQPHVDATRRLCAAGERALVLHGGGSAGNAWEIGVIAGLFDAGLDVKEADLTIGTSAGATAAAQLTSTTPTDLFAAILSATPPQWTGPVGRGGGHGPIGPAANHMEVTNRIIAAAENADLAAGYARVLVLSPFGGRSRHPLEWGMQLAAQVDELRAGGSSVETIFPDDASLKAFGTNMMDPSTRPPAARAGNNQGRALAGQLTKFWR